MHANYQIFGLRTFYSRLLFEPQFYGLLYAFANNNDTDQAFLLLCTLISVGNVRLIHEPRHELTNVLVSDLADTDQAVQLQKMARGLKFRILKVEGSSYLCSEADLRLCFCICEMLVFS